MLSDPSFPIEQFQHLPNPYPHDAIRDSFLRTNIVNLDLASPPPQRSNPRSHPLTPPDTPERRRTESDQSQDISEAQKEKLQIFLTAGLLVDLKNVPTRYLVVGGVPPDAPTQALTRVFSRMGDLKGMFVRYQKQGIVVLSWHDIRDAKKAQAILISGLFFGAQEPLVAAFITPSNLIKATGESPFVNGREGNISITAEQQLNPNAQQPVSLHAALALFGELSSFVVNPGTNSTTYLASYYDAREATNAAKALNGRSILGMMIHVVEGLPHIPNSAPVSFISVDVQESQAQFQSEREYSPQDISISEFHRTPYNNIRRTTRTISNPSPPVLSLDQTSKRLHPGENGRRTEPLSPSSTASVDASRDNRPALNRSRSSSDLETQGSTKPNLTTSFTTESKPQNRSISPSHLIPRTLPPRLSLPWLNPQTHQNSIVYGNQQYISAQYPQMFNLSSGYSIPQVPQLPPIPQAPYTYMPNQSSPGSFQANLSLPSQSVASSTNDSGPSTPLRTFGYSPTLSKRGSFDHSPQVTSGELSRRSSLDPTKDLVPPPIIVEPPTHAIHSAHHAHTKEARISRSSSTISLRDFIPSRPMKQEIYSNLPPERNSVDVERIEAGLDTRTTVMLKNVPNKMSDADLRKYISDVVPNSFDFVYLRFDFSSSANVGYAFVNFIEVSDLLKFAKARLGVKWNMFCSEKVLQMSYANFQGKEALVEKFRNSCVMEMQDEWVPKIFYSSGPLKGQREPFPPATNPSRARRSQDQRERGLLRTTNPYVAASRHLHYKPHHSDNHQD